MFLLDESLVFPDPRHSNTEGLVAVGGDLSLQRLELAYRSGIFPWFEEDDTLLWWSPDPRMVLFPKDLKVSKSMRQFLRKTTYKVTYNQAFEEVIQHCATVPRFGQYGTWITKNMQKAYLELHYKGLAKSVEVWEQEQLVGGLYGIDLGRVFCGESMFSLRPNTSKMALVSLVRQLEQRNYQLIDCQMYTEHLASMGATEIPREVFLSYL